MAADATTTVNLKLDRPTLEEARRRLAEALHTARQEKRTVLKLVHGYGSSGVGGVLRDGLRASLRKRRKKDEIRDFIAGENFSVFDEKTREYLEEHPHLRRDPDLDRGNQGISIVFL